MAKKDVHGPTYETRPWAALVAFLAVPALLSLIAFLLKLCAP